MQNRWKQAGQVVILIALVALAMWKPWEQFQQPAAKEEPPAQRNTGKSTDTKSTSKPETRPATDNRPANSKPRSESPAAQAEDDEQLPINTEHILHGQINSRGDLVGMHHLPSAPKKMRAGGKLCDVEIKVTSSGGDKDVVAAHVRLVDPDTGSTVREKNSTLYPAAWSEATIIAVIHEAYADAVKNHKVNDEGFFTGHARGLRIDGYLTRDGNKINTAYPVLPASGGRSR